jgi:protein ImuA
MSPLSTPFQLRENPALACRAGRLGLEEAWGEGLPGRVAASVFGLLRAAEGDERPVVLVATTPWLREQGRWFRDGLKGLGLGDARLLFIETARDAQTLWALEECFKSGAVAGAVAAADAVTLLASRRLDMAAREAKACCLLLRSREPRDISAARRRWRIASAPSAVNPDDEAAPGATRLTAALTRSRGEPPGEWTLEWDDEAHRFRLASGLADHGLVPDGRTAALG